MTSEREQHSPIGASGAGRWIPCPGSRRLTEHLPRHASQFAAEGTAAHMVGEWCFVHGKDASYYVGREIEVDGFTFEVDQAMADAVQVYVDTIRNDRSAIVKRGARPILEIEKKFHLTDLHPDLYGRNDALLIDDQAGRLTVYDYKHGAGTPVYAENNPQLKMYGLGALYAFKVGIEVVELVIVQPRCTRHDDPVQRWEIDAFDLLDWGDELAAAAKATEAPDAPLVPGPHCHTYFCAAAGRCTAQRDMVYDAAQADYDDDTGLALTPPELIGANAMPEILSNADKIEGWLKAVEAAAHRMAEDGDPPTGFKLVEKQGHRAFVDDDASVSRTMIGAGVPEDKVWNFKLASPAQIETAYAETTVAAGQHKTKAAAKRAFADEFGPMIVQPITGTILVPESDSRPAVRRSPEDDYGDVD